MNTTQYLSATDPEPSFGDEVAEFLPWVAAVVVLAPITLLSLMLWAPFLLVFALVAAPAAAAGLIAIAGAILATPYLLLRHWRQHADERRRSLTRSPVISAAIARTTVGGRQ
jgi:glucose-6-phosphate-specific signal transduction histidine kinase